MQLHEGNERLVTVKHMAGTYLHNAVDRDVAEFAADRFMNSAVRPSRHLLTFAARETEGTVALHVAR
ncbi:hypothetical protein FB565_004289 [Actinoplanes lutulentus]|uniref:hypothetical protein n=1 Tax=Actinoplanes lutulentus TaxID=1287878 RepID=UPI001859D114|nr:hypothetical protein [Actinoplanes lutulentus]MBB2944560.1 hypothetical protein [Actinoplanes lutulentus]